VFHSVFHAAEISPPLPALRSDDQMMSVSLQQYLNTSFDAFSNLVSTPVATAAS